MKKEKLGRPPAGGPRVQVRFYNERQLKQVESKIKAINKKSKHGESVSRNRFIIDAIMAAVKKKG